LGQASAAGGAKHEKRKRMDRPSPAAPPLASEPGQLVPVSRSVAVNLHAEADFHKLRCMPLHLILLLESETFKLRYDIPAFEKLSENPKLQIGSSDVFRSL
jgi:hypothetical protein